MDPLETGSRISDFEIVRLLGEGARSHVYLARQLTLDRLIVLKVTDRLGPHVGDEGRTQAALEHEHIVPVYAEQVVGDRRLLAMRWLPGITVARLQQQLEGTDRRRITGQLLVNLVDGAAGQPPHPTDTWHRDRLVARSSVVRATCHLMAGLARALEHAHRHGILHRDIKPANILFAQNGRAMLMDFDLAARTLGAGHAVIGGTPAYMAPEHLAALVSVPQPAEQPVDERSDMFSLGVVFYELLTGRHPFCQVPGPSSAAMHQMIAERLQGAPSVQSAGLRVSPGLESIVTKCLAPGPSDRYESAGQLAEDLDRFLDNRPLRYARDPSWAERSGKWLRRHPRSVSAAAAVLVACFAGLVATWVMESWILFQAESLIRRGSAGLEQGPAWRVETYIEEADRLLGEAGLASRLLGLEGRRARLRVEWRQLAAKTASLEHDRFGILIDAERPGFDPESEAGALRQARTYQTDPLAVFRVLDRDDWWRRVSFRSLKPPDQIQIEQDVTELLLDRALEAMRTPPSNRLSPPANEIVQDLLSRVPPRHRQCQAMQRLTRAITGDHEPGSSAQLPPLTDLSEFDLYLMGIAELKQGNDEQVVRCLNAAIQRGRETGQPPRFWAYFQRAHCFDRLGRTEQAIADYGTCIGLRSNFTWPHHNLGLIYARRGEHEQAAQHFRDALACDPELGPSYINLGAAQCGLGRFAEADDSFSRAIDNGHLTAKLLAKALANRSAARAALGNQDDALADAKRAIEIDPSCETARRNLELLGGVTHGPH